MMIRPQKPGLEVVKRYLGVEARKVAEHQILLRNLDLFLKLTMERIC